MRKVDPVLQERIETLVSSMGYELFGCETVSQGSQMVFRIYIDSRSDLSEKQGVSLDDCSKVSHQVSAMLDVDNPFQGRYSLEVSSPGLDRPLFALKHYAAAVGSRVKVRLYTPINQRRQFTGILQQVVGEDIHLLVDDVEQVVVPFSAIEKANVVSDVFVRKAENKKRKRDK